LGEVDINHKTERFNYLYVCDTVKRMLENETRTNTQMKFYNITAIRRGLHGCETWVVTPTDKSRLQAAEMRFLRPVIGITTRGKIRNDYIMNKLHVENLTRYQIRRELEAKNIIPRQMMDYQQVFLSILNIVYRLNFTIHKLYSQY
jgi:hypothetical protein